MISLHLPYPPSANRLWRNVPGKGTLKSGHYRLWLAEALASLRAQRAPSLTGSYRLTISADRPDRRARDIDNIIKPVSDALKAAAVIEDDCLAQSVTAFWSGAPPAKPGSISVTLEPADQPTTLHTLSKADLVALIERAQDLLANRFAEAA